MKTATKLLVLAALIFLTLSACADSPKQGDSKKEAQEAFRDLDNESK